MELLLPEPLVNQYPGCTYLGFSTVTMKFKGISAALEKCLLKPTTGFFTKSFGA